MSGAGDSTKQRVLNSLTATRQREGKELEGSGSRSCAIVARQELLYSQACCRARAAFPAPQDPASTQRAAEQGWSHLECGAGGRWSRERAGLGTASPVTSHYQVQGAARQEPRSLLLLLPCAGRQREHTRSPSPSTAALAAAMAPPAPSRSSDKTKPCPTRSCRSVGIHNSPLPKGFHLQGSLGKGVAAAAAEELPPGQGNVTAPDRPQSRRRVSPGHGEEPLTACHEASPPLRDISAITQASLCLSAPGSHHSLFVTEILAPADTPGTARASFQLMLQRGHCFPLNTPGRSLPGHPGNVRVKCPSPVDSELSSSHPPGNSSRKGPWTPT